MNEMQCKCKKCIDQIWCAFVSTTWPQRGDKWPFINFFDVFLAVTHVCLCICLNGFRVFNMLSLSHFRILTLVGIVFDSFNYPIFAYIDVFEYLWFSIKLRWAFGHLVYCLTLKIYTDNFHLAESVSADAILFCEFEIKRLLNRFSLFLKLSILKYFCHRV